MIRTSIKLGNALKYEYSGLSFNEVLRKSGLTKVTKSNKRLKLPVKTNSTKNSKVDPIKDLHTSDLLVKQLIDSDFIYSRKPINKRVPDVVDSTLSTKENNLVCTLDVFKLNKSIKQFIKILETLDTLKSKQKIELYVLCKNKHYLRLVDIMARRYSLKDTIKVCTILPDLSGKSNKDITKYLFILGEYELNKNFLSHLIYYRVSLISKFNLKYERKTSGFYKIQNNLDDYKKLMFLFILIEKVLGKKNPIKNKSIVNKGKLLAKPLVRPIILVKRIDSNEVSSYTKALAKLKSNANLRKSIQVRKTRIGVGALVYEVEKRLRTNNFVSVVSKRKNGLVLSKKAKRYLRLKKEEKGTFLPITPRMKNNVLPNNKNPLHSRKEWVKRTVRK